MVCGPTGSLGSPAWSRVGIQYADRSPGALQAVLPAWSEAVVEWASVVSLPMKVWSWDLPGWPGKTIGSSGAVWVTEQLAWNSWKYRCGGSASEGSTPVTGGTAGM